MGYSLVRLPYSTFGTLLPPLQALHKVAPTKHTWNTAGNRNPSIAPILSLAILVIHLHAQLLTAAHNALHGTKGTKNG